MPKCTILKETPVQGNVSRYEVILEADDGYTEQQVYQCSEAKLKEAIVHFNESHLAVDTVDGDEPRVITIKTSKHAALSLAANALSKEED